VAIEANETLPPEAVSTPDADCKLEAAKDSSERTVDDRETVDPDRDSPVPIW
jgi:hypothetical protein